MTVKEQVEKAIRDVPNFPKEGILFKDITPVLEDPVLSQVVIDEFVETCRDIKIDAVAGIESRGFLFGFPIAMALGVPFIMIRKKGKLPYETVSYKYDLEYGSAEIEMHVDTVKEGMNVLVHDDLLATGGTAIAGAELIKKQGATIAGFSFLVELGFLKGKEKLKEYSQNIVTITSY